MHMCHGHCNDRGISKENRKHARLMQKANKLGAQDLLEIAAMKGITMVADTKSTAELSLAAEPAVGIGSVSAGSVASSGISGSETPTAAAAMSDIGIAPPLEVDVMSEVEEDERRSVPETADEDARL
jgi:hypothetical protein